MDANVEIKRLLEARIAALMRKDAASANSVLDARIVAFEVAGPLQITKDQATDDSLTQAWLDSFERGPRITVEELCIHADGDVGFCHSLHHLEGRRSDGGTVDVTMRSTIGFRRLGGEWKIVHSHTSLPR